MTPSYTKTHQGPETAQCDTCDGRGYVIPYDACPACASVAEAEYRSSTGVVDGTFSQNLRKVA